MIALAVFRRIVRQYYTGHGRRLPWRATYDPYRILVSEIMLQQTQAERVVGFYKKFIKRFPTVRSLANASVREVLTLWSGLGYNRRAVQLHRAAQKLVVDYRGKMPVTPALIDELPGVGEYTARAVAAFAFNLPSVFIETNIRTVYLHHFFSRAKKVSDKKLVPLIEKTLDHTNPREWYWALMDYGAYLKKIYPNPSRRSLGHVVQSKFEGSFRQLRGALLKLFLERTNWTTSALARKTKRTAGEVKKALAQLKKEGLVV